MFCPTCGQKQVSEQIRFCSRCGFSFEIVAQLLDHNGYLPQLEEINRKQNSRLTRSNGFKLALIWAFGFMLCLAPLAAAVGVDGLGEFFAALGFGGGLFIFVFSLLFLKKAQLNRESKNDKPMRIMREPNAIGAGGKNALPPQQTVPAAAYVPPPDARKTLDTFDLSRPGSVTEGTTKLLEKDE